MDGWMDVQIDVWMDGLMYNGCVDGLMYGWIDVCMDGLMYGWMDECMDECMDVWRCTD